jgi:hypothetical protein
MISNYGRIYNRISEKIKSINSISSNGYAVTSLSTKSGIQKQYGIHRLVLMTFCPVDNYQDLQVNHINGIKTDNRLSNLEWCTAKYNVNDAFKRDMMRGNESRMSKINYEQANQICTLLQDKSLTIDEISNIVGGRCTPNIVSSISKGRDWKSVSCNYNLPHRGNTIYLTDEKVHNLCKYFEANKIKEGTTYLDYCKSALRFFGYDDSINIARCAVHIYRRQSRTNISSKYNF